MCRMKGMGENRLNSATFKVYFPMRYYIVERLSYFRKVFQTSMSVRNRDSKRKTMLLELLKSAVQNVAA